MCLAGAFADFIAASARLETSYGTLQREVKQLSQELAERNAALKASLAENDRVHRSLRGIVESMPCGVLVVDGAGSIAIINSEARSMLDLTSKAPVNLQQVSYSAGVNLQQYLTRDRNACYEQELATTRHEGTRWLSVHTRSLSPSGHHPVAPAHCQTIIILRDITAHKQAEQERERARKAIALSEVATTLAHEIRNPLAALELFAGLIAAGEGDAAEWISHLHAGIRSLSSTVNNVLSFHGNGYPELTALDLTSTIRSSVEFARPIADEAGVRLTFDGAATSVRAMGNASALQQVVLNMICNAVRHSPKGREVIVSVRQKRGARKLGQKNAIIQFRDHGSGIAQDHLNKIFQAGFSGSGTTSGLGLAVCSQIVGQHGGSIQVTSKVGEGTTFSVEIPTL
jgi:two-component system sensor histidine kinase FlrB